MSARSATAWIAIFAILAVAGLRLFDDPGAGGDPRGGESAAAIDPAERPGHVADVRVTRVVDGDTIKVRLAGRQVTVRYIGVDTPETVKPGAPVECFGKAASHFNERLVAGRQVRLTLDREPRDRYGRLLAYVDIGGRSVNAELLRRGYARTIEISPNTARAAEFRRLENAAQAAGKGIWQACPLP